MNTTISFPMGWPSRTYLGNAFRLQICAKGDTILEVLEDATRQHGILCGMVGEDKQSRPTVYLYLNEAYSRNLPLQLETLVQEGDIIEVNIINW